MVRSRLQSLSLLATACFYAATSAALAGPADSAKANGYLAATLIVPGLVTWFLARRADPRWSWLKVIGIYVALVAVCLVLSALGRSGGR